MSPTLPAALLRATEIGPERPFLTFEGTTYTYGDVLASVKDVARRLSTAGISKGDRVALYLENSPEFINAYFGVLWLGGVVVLVNTRYRQTELTHILTDSGARLLVTDPSNAADAKGVAPEITSLEEVVVVGDDGGWERFEAGARDPGIVPTADDVAVIGYTSGTTGRSKGAMLTHRNLVSNSEAVTTSWGWTRDDHLLLVLPLFHIHGLGVGLNGTLVQASRLTLRRAFDPADVLTELATGRYTMFFGVPTMYSRLLAEAERRSERPKGLRLLVSGSAPLSPQVLADVEREFGLRILERYGMTETVMNLGNPLNGPRKAGSVGLPFPGIDARVVGPAGIAASGEIGEIELRGPNICRGYWANPEATDEVLTADGWFRTGDLGYRDEDGYFFLTGRSRELIISGGFNVYPREVEETLEDHPAVAEAAVLGLPDRDLGEKVVAAIVPASEVSMADLQQFCGERLAGFKKPREVHFVTSLPRNALGKVQKHILREQLEAIRSQG